jgi:hypothetical protein
MLGATCVDTLIVPVTFVVVENVVAWFNKRAGKSHAAAPTQTH